MIDIQILMFARDSLRISCLGYFFRPPLKKMRNIIDVLHSITMSLLILEWNKIVVLLSKIVPWLQFNVRYYWRGFVEIAWRFSALEGCFPLKIWPELTAAEVEPRQLIAFKDLKCINFLKIGSFQRHMEWNSCNHIIYTTQLNDFRPRMFIVLNKLCSYNFLSYRNS